MTLRTVRTDDAKKTVISPGLTSLGGKAGYPGTRVPCALTFPLLPPFLQSRSVAFFPGHAPPLKNRFQVGWVALGIGFRGYPALQHEPFFQFRSVASDVAFFRDTLPPRSKGSGRRRGLGSTPYPPLGYGPDPKTPKWHETVPTQGTMSRPSG